VPVEVTGRIEGDIGGSCPSVTFRLKTYTVRTTSATTFTGGNCRDLRQDRQVTVTGIVEAPATLVATRVAIKK